VPGIQLASSLSTISQTSIFLLFFLSVKGVCGPVRKVVHGWVREGSTDWESMFSGHPFLSLPLNLSQISSQELADLRVL